MIKKQFFHWSLHGVTTTEQQQGPQSRWHPPKVKPFASWCVVDSTTTHYTTHTLFDSTKNISLILLLLLLLLSYPLSAVTVDNPSLEQPGHRHFTFCPSVIPYDSLAQWLYAPFLLCMYYLPPAQNSIVLGRTKTEIFSTLLLLVSPFSLSHYPWGPWGSPR